MIARVRFALMASLSVNLHHALDLCARATQWREPAPDSWLLTSVFSLRSTRVPTFDIMGSLFPAWLVCLAAAILLTVAMRWLLVRLRIPLPFPVVIYPSLTALLTFSLWLAFFG